MEDSVFYSNTEEAGVRPLSSALKTLHVLDLLGSQERPVRLAEVARASGMSRATAHQKLVTLVRAGWIEHTAEGAYQLSLHAARIGSMALAHAGLGERLVPFLRELVAAAGETASLAVMDGAKAHIVQRVEAAGMLRADLHVGAMLDLAESASGRVLVAFADAPTLDRLRHDGVPLPAEKLLAQVRRERFAASSGKSFAGVRGAAVPIFGPHGGCTAALSLVGPLPRFNVERARAPLQRAAAAIDQYVRGRAA
jgi:DNA-binding IclR family transcriptional regulator